MRRNRIALPPHLLHVAAAFLSKGSAAAMQFVQTLVFSRALGAEGLGLYYVALSIYRVAETAAPLGIQTSTVREIAGAKAHAAWASVRALALRSALICGALGLLASVLAWAFADRIAAMLDDAPEAANALRWMAVAIAPGCIVLSLTSALRGLGRQSLANLLGSLVLPLVATILFLFAFRQTGYLGAVHAFIGGQLTALALLSLALVFSLRGKPDKTEPGHSLVQSAFPFWIVSVASLANDSLGILLLGLLGSTQDAGIFGVAVRLAMPLSFLGASIQAVCDSRFAGLYRLGDTNGLRVEYRAALRLSLLLAVSMGLVLALFSAPLLGLFGAEFREAQGAFLVLLVSICLLSAFGPAGSYLSMAGQAHVNAWTALAAMPVSAALMLVFIPLWGAMGAAFATSVALSLRVLVQAGVTERALRHTSP